MLLLVIHAYAWIHAYGEDLKVPNFAKLGHDHGSYKFGIVEESTPKKICSQTPKFYKNQPQATLPQKNAYATCKKVASKLVSRPPSMKMNIDFAG